jgi:hypothetical protein
MELYMDFENASRALVPRRLCDGKAVARLAPSIVFAVIAALILPVAGCGRSDKNHVAVHPVQGAIQFRGQPMEGAFVSLHPKSATDGVPTPRATVAKDGTFTVTTYNGNDGAPEGDYVVTVQWYRPVRVGTDLVGGPNVLPAKYASAQTSDVQIRVAAGENQLQPIQLR